MCDACALWNGEANGSGDFSCLAAGGDGFQANSTTPGVQNNANSGRLADGRFYILYESPDSTGQTDIRVRFFDKFGEALGNDILVHQGTANSQVGGASLITNDGNILFTWRTTTTADPANGQLFGRFFNSSGTAIGNDFQISTAGADGSYTFFQRSNGMYVFAYVNDGEILGRTFFESTGASGLVLNTASLAETQLNTTLPGTPNRLGIQTLSNSNNFILRYISPEGTPAPAGDGQEVRNRLIGFSGNEFLPQTVFSSTDDYLVNTTLAGEQTTVRSTRLAGGKVLEVWASSDTGDGSSGGIRGRILSASGVPTGNDFIVNATTTGNQTAPGILAFDDGRRLVYWSSFEGSGVTIRGRWALADTDDLTYSGNVVDGDTGVDWSTGDFVIAALPGTSVPNLFFQVLADQRVVAIYQGPQTNDASGDAGVQASIMQVIGAFNPFPSPDPLGTAPVTDNTPFDLALPNYDWTQSGAQISRNIIPGNNFNDSIGSAHTLTYAYRESLATADEAIYYSPNATPNGASGFTPYNALQIAAAEQAIALLEDVANIDFVRVQNAASPYSNDANLLLWNYANVTANSQAASAGGFGFWRSGAHNTNTTANGYGFKHFSYLNDDRANVLTPTYENGGVSLLIHEIGHTIGLTHPGNYNISAGGFQTFASDAVYKQDNKRYTVMSYFDETIGHAIYSNTDAATPLLHDIAALQRLYGVNTTTRTGDTVYGFNSNTGRAALTLTAATDQRVFSIWDAGGIDTLDFSLHTQNQQISLVEENFSNTGGLQFNVSIAKGAVIENAISGSGDDYLEGNASANILIGNSGDDGFRGGGGNDTILGGAGVDVLLLSGSRGNYATAKDSGNLYLFDLRSGSPDGLDRVTSIETYVFQSSFAMSAEAFTPVNLNGDLNSDILWCNTSGLAVSFLMNGTSITGAAAIGPANGASWRVKATGDIDGDGDSDLIWQDTGGLVVAYLMENGAITSAGVLANPGAAFSVVGTGEFNGDGVADIILQNAGGQAVVWNMDGLTISSGAAVGPANGPDWSVAAIGDLNGDGVSDLVWEHTDGTTVGYLMNTNGTILSANLIAGANGAAFSVMGIGDLNADGKGDIVWQFNNGQAGAWLMNGLAIAGGNLIGGANGAQWQVRDVSDISGDGKMDLVWQNMANGQAVGFIMNGTTITSAGLIGGANGADWFVV